MPKEKTALTLIGLEVDRESGSPLYQQLYEQLRRVILEGRLIPGQRLPPTRELAEHLKLSRSTVLLAFEHLAAEGYAEGKTGAGTFVSEKIPEYMPLVGVYIFLPPRSRPGTGICALPASGN